MPATQNKSLCDNPLEPESINRCVEMPHLIFCARSSNALSFKKTVRLSGSQLHIKYLNLAYSFVFQLLTFIHQIIKTQFARSRKPIKSAIKHHQHDNLALFCIECIRRDQNCYRTPIAATGLYNMKFLDIKIISTNSYLTNSLTVRSMA